MKNNAKNTNKPKESQVVLYSLLVVCVVLGIFSAQNKKKRNQLEEVKKLPFHSVQIENVQDGIYNSETATSFLYVQLNAEVFDGKLKDIKIINMNGKGSDHLEEICKKMVEENSTRIEIKHGQELETLVLMSCVDSALSGITTNQEITENNAEDKLSE